MFEEKSSDLWVLSGLTSEVETNDASWVVLGCDAGQQNVQPSERDAFSSHGNAEKELGVKVVQETVCFAPIYADEACDPILVL
jgi:hypothetical protein